MLKIRSPFGPLSEFFGSPFKLGTVVYYVVWGDFPTAALELYSNPNRQPHLTFIQVVEAVRKSFKSTEEEMKRKASMIAKKRSDKEFAFSQQVYSKED